MSDRSNQATSAQRSAAGRRHFLTKLAAVAALPLTTGLTLVELAGAAAGGEAVTSKRRWGLLIDSAKCASDCDACVRACNEEHALQTNGRPETDAQWIRKLTVEDDLTGRLSSFPLLCQHCANPPCVDVCPTGASFKRADGIVLVDKHTCIGCRYCMMACPYKARSFVHEPVSNQKSYSPRGMGTVESCTLCVHRIDADTPAQPACVEACGTDGGKAMVFGDLNDPKSELMQAASQTAAVQIREDLGLDTGVRYAGL